ncbi:CAP domain-containing protein, partial [Salmonella sp. s54412]|uniref:CAP domain-containing protein n=1 Tax=Salmonella sp. s54412 TaxID=3160128 RepID=UPI003754582C
EALDRGENIAISGDKNFDAKSAVEMWYREERFYDYEAPGFSSNTRNFTQMLWNGTEEVGMALSRSEDGQLVVIVARYYPPGNVVGLFEENVKQKNDDP